MAQAPGGEVLVYEAPDGGARVDVRLEQETVWLRQEQMGQLFGRERSVITKHIRNVFAEGELDEKGNVQNLHIAGSDKPVRFYNLEVIISVGYRVKSLAGTRFRQWATRTLREHLVRGYTINQQRFEHNARELEAALALVRKAAAGEAGEFWGRLVESAVGAHLANAAAGGELELYYWRERNQEVGFVVKAGRRLAAIEVKSGRAPQAHRGTAAFAAAFKPQRSLLVGGDGIELGEFLSQPASRWIPG